MDTTMDNQQATENELRLAWLGGVTDSDGCISMSERNRRGRREINVTFVITNSDPLFIELVASILSENGVAHHVDWHAPSQKGGWNKKPFGTVRCTGYKCLAVLNLLQPYILAKNEQVNLVLEFLENRISNSTPSVLMPYSKRDWEIFDRVRELKHAGASETTRETSLNGDDDIVQAEYESLGIL